MPRFRDCIINFRKFVTVMFYKLWESVCNTIYNLLAYMGSTFKNSVFVFQPMTSPCNHTSCKKFPIHIPIQSFTSPNTNLNYPITTLADCKFSNLVYQLQCKKCNDFSIGKTGQMISKWINGHRSTCTVMGSDLPVPIHTQSHQLPSQECWSVRVIQKTPWCHPWPCQPPI